MLFAQHCPNTLGPMQATPTRVYVFKHLSNAKKDLENGQVNVIQVK
jgi:hypothetical protein